MKKNVKIIIVSVLAVLIIIASAAAVMAPMKLELSALAEESVSITFTEQGTFSYENTYTVYSLVSGEVLEVSAKVGSKVNKGDTLAVISASDYEYQIEKLQSGIDSYNAQISSLWEQEKREKDALSGEKDALLGQIASIEAQISGNNQNDMSIERQISFQEDAVDNFRKIVRDMRERVREARDYEDYDNDYAADAAETELAQAEQALASSKVLLEQLQAGKIPEGYYEGQLQSLNSQLASINTRIGRSYSSGMTSYYNSLISEAETGIKQLRERQGQATTTSPVSGTIIEMNADDSNIIGQQSPVCSIGWDESVEVYVATRELDSIKVGDRVELKHFRRQGDEVSFGTVVKIEDKAEIRASALGVEESKVRLLIKPDSGELMIGEHVDVIFTVFKQESALTVPKTAVFELEGKDMVWLVSDGVAQMREIEKGTETRAGYIVKSGLSSGDNVIKDANVQGLKSGKKITAANNPS